MYGFESEATKIINNLLQFPVAHTFRLHIAETHLLVLLILTVGSLKVKYFGVPLKSKYMGTDTIQEPAVVRNHNGTSGEVLKSLFQCTEGVHIDIVGRLIEQQHVGLSFEGECQMQAIAFSSREHPAKLLLVGTGEVKAGEVSTCIDLLTANADELRTVRNHLVYCFVWVNRLVLLIHIGGHHGLTHLECSFIRMFHPLDQAEEGGLTCTIGTYDTHDAVGGEHEVEVVEQQLVAECLGHVLCFNHLVTEAGTIGDEDLQLLFPFLLILVEQLLV